MSLLPVAHRRHLVVMAILYGIWWIAWGISPHSRSDWWLENVLIFFTAAVLAITARWFVFSRTAYTLVFGFAFLHTIGSHYTYSEVPMAEWIESLTGWRWPGERNHFDRVIHFLYGLLILWPYREAFFHAAVPRAAFWGYLLPFSFILSTSLGYEMMEWAAAEIFGGDLGMAFLGTQGDVWDAHWDLFWATTGAGLAVLIMIALRLVTGRDFPREWGERWGRKTLAR